MNKKKILFSLSLLTLLAITGFTVVADDHEGSWTGEVIDLACYVGSGGQGAEHSDCAKACIKGGQPMGLLTDDGTLVLLAADSKDGQPYEALKDMAGDKASVSGTLAKKDGMKVVTVTGSKAAS